MFRQNTFHHVNMLTYRLCRFLNNHLTIEKAKVFEPHHDLCSLDIHLSNLGQTSVCTVMFSPLTHLSKVLSGYLNGHAAPGVRPSTSAPHTCLNGSPFCTSATRGSTLWTSSRLFNFGLVLLPATVQLKAIRTSKTSLIPSAPVVHCPTPYARLISAERDSFFISQGSFSLMAVPYYTVSHKDQFFLAPASSLDTPQGFSCLPPRRTLVVLHPSLPLHAYSWVPRIMSFSGITLSLILLACKAPQICDIT